LALTRFQEAPKMAKTRSTKRDGDTRDKLDRKFYEQALPSLQLKLCELQESVK
jgi:hypothetical protein